MKIEFHAVRRYSESMKLLSILFVSSTLLSACATPGYENSMDDSGLPDATSEGPVIPECPPVANSLAPGKAPTPFTADEIRMGNAPGTWKRYRISQGEREFFQHFEFVQAEKPELAAMKVVMYDVEGNELGATEAPPAAWTALQAHASFDEDKTVIGRDTIQVAAGEFDCWTYTVDTAEGEQSFYWFGIEQPGPPVLMETRVNGAVQKRMELFDLGTN